MSLPVCLEDLIRQIVDDATGTTSAGGDFDCNDLQVCSINSFQDWPTSNDPCVYLHPDGSGGYEWGQSPIIQGDDTIPVPDCPTIKIDVNTGEATHNFLGSWVPFGGGTVDCSTVCECVRHTQDFAPTCDEGYGIKSNWVPAFGTDHTMQTVCITAQTAPATDEIVTLWQRCGATQVAIGSYVLFAGQTRFCGNFAGSAVIPDGCEWAIEVTNPGGGAGSTGLFVSFEYTKTCT